MKSLFCLLIGGGYTDDSPKNPEKSEASENAWVGFERKVPPRRPDQRLNMLKFFSHRWAKMYLEEGCQENGGCERPHPRHWLQTPFLVFAKNLRLGPGFADVAVSCL